MLSKKRQYASNSAYYLNGTFENKKAKINFKKAYWLEGVFYMEECSGKLPLFKFNAKELSIDKNRYIFKTIKYRKNKKNYIKHHFSLIL